MWIKKLKQKKLQYFLIALILMCITAILSGCICYVLGMANFNDTYFSKEILPEYYFASQGEEGIEALKEFAEETNSLSQFSVQEGKTTTSEFKIGDQTVATLQPLFLSLEDVDDLPFHFQANGEIKRLKSPEPGTVWVSSVFADLRDIEVGDIISFEGKEDKNYHYTIAGTYNASICPSSTMSFYPYYMNPEDISDMTDLTSGYYGSFTRYNQEDSSLEAFLETLPREHQNSLFLDYTLDIIIESFTMTTILMGGISTAAAFLIFIVSIIIFRFIIKSNLNREYKAIGIYKSLGFESTEIIGFYIKGYLLIAGIGILLGAIAGFPIAQGLGNISVNYVGEFSLDKHTAIYPFIVSIALLFIFILNVFASLRKIKRMNPVKALTMEMSSSKSRFKKALIKNAHSPLSMAVNDIFKRKGSSIMITLILIVAFYLSVFFTMINYSCANMGNNSPTWFAVPNPDCFVNIVITEEIEDTIEDSEYVDRVFYGQFFLKYSIEWVDGVKSMSNVSITSLSDFSEDLTGIKYSDGRAPEGDSEVAFSAAALGYLGVDVGEYIRLKINEVEKDYLITGEYNTMMNGGSGIQIPLDVLNTCEVPYIYNTAFVTLDDMSNYEAFKQEMEGGINGADVSKEITALSDSAKGIVNIVSPVTIILVTIFISFSFLNIINMLLINNIENRKNFGILKALGFTNAYIMLQNVSKIVILSVVSIVVSLVIHYTISAKFFYAMLTVDGLITSIPLMAALLGGMLILIIFASLMFSIPLRKIAPIDLMEE